MFPTKNKHKRKKTTLLLLLLFFGTNIIIILDTIKLINLNIDPKIRPT